MAWLLQEYEFQHAKAPSRQSSYSSHDGRSFHERQRSHSQAASTGTSGLAGLNLMPQSLLPEIMPDIPQLMINTPGEPCSPSIGEFYLPNLALWYDI